MRSPLSSGATGVRRQPVVVGGSYAQKREHGLHLQFGGPFSDRLGLSLKMRVGVTWEAGQGHLEHWHYAIVNVTSQCGIGQAVAQVVVPGSLDVSYLIFVSGHLVPSGFASGSILAVRLCQSHGRGARAKSF